MSNIQDAVEVANATGDNFQKRPLVSIIVVLLVVVALLFWVIWKKDQQIIDCKDKFADKVEFLMAQADEQRQSLLTRQAALIEKVDYLTKVVEKKKK